MSFDSMGMRTFIKHRGGFDYEAWTENMDEVLCHARILKAGDVTLITMIKTTKSYRDKGLARALVKAIQEKFENVMAAGIVEEAAGFWAKVGIKEGLSPEERGVA